MPRTVVPARRHHTFPLPLAVAALAVALVAGCTSSGPAPILGGSGSPTSTPTAAASSPDVAPANGVSGYVYYDRNDNGVRDPGEPGIAGIRVRDKKGDASTLTGPDGFYSFATVPQSPFLQVETGWFRSQCPPDDNPTAMNCPSGTGTDNKFKVNNQFIQYDLNGSPASNVDVGLLPGWPGGGEALPAVSGGAVPANAVDVAARLSWESGCADGDYAVCGKGSAFTMSAQVFNQGTTPLTGIRARVYVPPGDCATGVSLVDYTVPTGLGAATVTPASPTCSDRYLDISLAGTLVPAGGVRLDVGGRTESGPGTPGCTMTNPDPDLCPTSEPQSRGWLFGISHIDQTGDPDSTFCAAGDMTQCPIGLHDKRRAPDEIDPAGHTVDAALGGPDTYTLHPHVVALGGAATASAGSPVSLRAWVSNQVAGGVTNASPSGVRIEVWLPAGSVVDSVPAPHKLIQCDKGKASGAGLLLTCTLGAPVAAYISSYAMDVTVTVPPGWSAATPFTAVACVRAPRGGPYVETGPTGDPCQGAVTPQAAPGSDAASVSWKVTG